MKTSTFFRYAVSVAGIATLLAGCSGGSSATPSSAQAFSRLPAGIAARLRFDPVMARALNELTPAKVAAAKAAFHPHRSWASPDIARAPRLLFISDSTTLGVNIYAMPGLVLKAGITGFTDPLGECADSSGRVWVADFTGQAISRFDRAGNLAGEIDNHDGYPWSCASDPSTGDLAVTNFLGPSFGEGNLTIYHNPPTGGRDVLTDPDIFTYEYAGYDASGHLWVDGLDSNGNPTVASCTLTPTAGCTTIPITGGTLHDAGFLEWTTGQRTWYIADGDCGGASVSTVCIYPVTPTTRGATLGAPISLVDPQGHAVCSMFQGTTTNHMSAVFAGGVDDSTCGGISSVARWSFPGGGAPTHGSDDTITPQGAAISMK